MKKQLIQLSVAAGLTLSCGAFAQGTHLDSPNGGPANAVAVGSNGDVNVSQNVFVARSILVGGNIVFTNLGQRMLFAQPVGGGNGIYSGNPKREQPAMLFVDGLTYSWQDFAPATAAGFSLGNPVNPWNRLYTQTVRASGGADFGGNVGIGTTAPLNKLTVQAALGSDDHINGQHSYQFQIQNGLGTHNSRSMGIGLLDNGKGVVQIKESDVGYNDLLLNPVAGNVGIGTVSPQSTLDVNGTTRSKHLELTEGPEVGAYINSTERMHLQTRNGNAIHLNPSGGIVAVNAVSGGELYVNGKVTCTTIVLSSDRNVKSGVQAADAQRILKQVVGLPISTWHYTNAPGVRHIGPMAQDFQAAFNVGEDDKHISVVDGLGVPLAAIQGLNAKVQAQGAEIAALKRQIASMKQQLASVKESVTDRLAVLEKLMAQLPAAGSADTLTASLRAE